MLLLAKISGYVDCYKSHWSKLTTLKRPTRINYKQNNPNPITGPNPSPSPPPPPQKVDVIQRSSGMSKQVNSLSQGTGRGGVSNIPPPSFSQFCPSLLSSSAFCGKLRTWNKPRWSGKDSITNGYTNSSCHIPCSTHFPWCSDCAKGLKRNTIS